MQIQHGLYDTTSRDFYEDYEDCEVYAFNSYYGPWFGRRDDIFVGNDDTMKIEYTNLSTNHEISCGVINTFLT